MRTKKQVASEMALLRFPWKPFSC